MDDEYPKGIDQLVEEGQKTKPRKRTRGIASLSGKSRDELIIPLDCIVEEVHGKVNDVFYTPPPEYSPEDDTLRPQRMIQTGQLYYSEIRVTCEDVVRNICFIGWPPLEAGDFIRAYIFRGKDDGVNAILGPLGLSDNHYVNRRFRASEVAVKIEKIRNGKVVAIYGS